MASAPAEMLTESKKGDRSNGNRPPDVKVNLVALDSNIMSDLSDDELRDDEDKLKCEMSDAERKR